MMDNVIKIVDSAERSAEAKKLLDTAQTFMADNPVTETMVFMKVADGTYHRLNTRITEPDRLVVQLELIKFDILLTMHGGVNAL